MHVHADMQPSLSGGGETATAVMDNEVAAMDRVVATVETGGRR
jgi:hypothetical protein